MKIDIISNFIKTIIILTFIFGLIGIVSAYEESDLQWSSGENYTVHLNDVITYNGYSIRAIGFPQPVESNRYNELPSESVNPFVALNVSKIGSFENNTVLGNGEYYITPDGELRVTVVGLPEDNSTEWLYESYDPWAVLEVEPRGIPDISVSVETDKTDYSPSQDTEIISYITVTNSGDGDALNVDLNIDAPFSVKNGSLKNHYERIKRGESITENIAFTMPTNYEDSIYDISSNLSAYDVKNKYYISNSSKQISVTVDPEWSMSFQKTTLEKIYLKDSAMISLDLKNNGKMDIKNVTIEDSIPKGFDIVGNTALNWVVDIPAGGDWNYHYIVKPLEPNNGIVFPVATAEFNINGEIYGIRSNQPKIVVYGPLVTLNKSTVSSINLGDPVSVTVTAKNIGSTPTNIFIRDQLPDNAMLISGITTYDGFLEAGKELNFSYILKLDSNLDSNSIELPPATAQYYQFGTKGILLNISSKKVDITVKSATNTNNTNNTNITNTSKKPIEIEIFNDNNTINNDTINNTINNTLNNTINRSQTNETIFEIFSKIIRSLSKMNIRYI